MLACFKIDCSLRLGYRSIYVYKFVKNEKQIYLSKVGSTDAEGENDPTQQQNKRQVLVDRIRVRFQLSTKKSKKKKNIYM